MTASDSAPLHALPRAAGRHRRTRDRRAADRQLQNDERTEAHRCMSRELLATAHHPVESHTGDTDVIGTTRQRA